MKSRFMIVLLSLAFAAAATLGAAYYIAKLKTSITEGQKLVEVVVANESIEAGTSVAEMVATGLLTVEKMPKQYVADGALKSAKDYSNRVLSSSVARGEQLNESKFRKVDENVLAFKLPDDMIAVSIAIDEVTGVGGKLQPGDKIDVIATFSPGPGDKDITKIMLQNIEILATSYSGTVDENGGLTQERQANAGKKTVTLAVLPSHAEKLVFAAEKGHIWLGLRNAGNTKLNQASGQTIETVFK